MAKSEGFDIDDDFSAADQRAIEVTIRMDDGSTRWCFFLTPSALANCGDLLPGTQIRLHLGVPHMIVVSEISADVIEHVIRVLDNDDALLEHTASLA